MPDSDQVRRFSNVLTFTGNTPGIRSPQKAQQLELTLDADKVVRFLSTKNLHGAQFLRVLYHAKPKIIVDLRYAPHFSFTAVPSEQIVRRIQSSNVCYVHNGLKFHELRHNILRYNPSEIIDNVISDAIKRGDSGPIVVLVQHPDDVRMIAPYVLGSLQKISGRQWSAEFIE